MKINFKSWKIQAGIIVSIITMLIPILDVYDRVSEYFNPTTQSRASALVPQERPTDIYVREMYFDIKDLKKHMIKKDTNVIIDPSLFSKSKELKPSTKRK